MNEASSKFVDRIVLEKLLNEKLKHVHHYPEANLKVNQMPFSDWQEFSESNIPELLEIENGFRFKSLVQSEYEENQLCQVIVHKGTLQEKEQQCKSLILQHGLFEENRDIYDFLIRNLNQYGFDVYQSTLPFHYGRTPKSSKFSGEYFWSAHFSRTQNAFKQAVYDMFTLYKIVQHKQDESNNHSKILLGGFSMGGAASLVLSSLADLQGVFSINPPTSFSNIIWDSPLCSTIKADFSESGYNISDINRAFKSFEPIALKKRVLSPQKVMLCYGKYDQITSSEQYTQLINGWGIDTSHEYKSGHLNTLRVPRLAQDIFNFYKQI